MVRRRNCNRVGSKRQAATNLVGDLSFSTPAPHIMCFLLIAPRHWNTKRTERQRCVALEFGALKIAETKFPRGLSCFAAPSLLVRMLLLSRPERLGPRIKLLCGFYRALDIQEGKLSPG